ncbi:Uncharacterised protein [Vibrio cholerae]|nr:Uncharacterised protein [Vibrio cholerae]
MRLLAIPGGPSKNTLSPAKAVNKQSLMVFSRSYTPSESALASLLIRSESSALRACELWVGCSIS